MDVNNYIAPWPSYSAEGTHPLLQNSTFTKLYFKQGTNMTYFDLFSHEQNNIGNNIYIWQVNWTKYLKNKGEN